MTTTRSQDLIPAGPTGPTGPAGPIGPTGPAGPAGVGTRRVYNQHDGTVNSAWRLPDGGAAAALRITGLIDLIWKGIPASWAPPAQRDFMGKMNSSVTNMKSYLFSLTTTSFLRFTFAATGGTNQTVTSAALPSDLTNFGGPVWLRCLADPTGGASGAAGASFFYSMDGSAWTQIGSLVTAAGGAVGPWASTTADLYVGRSQLGSGNPLAGRTYRAEVWNGNSTSGGTRVAFLDVQSIDPTTFIPGTSTFNDGTFTWASGTTSVLAASETTTSDILPGSILSNRVYGLDSVALARLGWMTSHNIDLRDPGYGIIGTTGDISVILNAIIYTAGRNGSGNGTSIYLPKRTGVYGITNPIIMQPNVGIYGDQGFSFGNTGACNIKRISGFPQTTTTNGSPLTLPADGVTLFDLPVSAVANFPMCPGGITLHNGIGVVRVGGVTIYYRGFDNTTPGANLLKNCTTNYWGAVIPTGAVVTCDMVWDGEPGDLTQLPGAYLRDLTLDAAGTQSRAFWSSHCAEGGGPRRCFIIGSTSGWMTFEYPPRLAADGVTTLSSQPPHNWSIDEINACSYSTSVDPIPDAVGIEVLGRPTNSGFGRGAFKLIANQTLAGGTNTAGAKVKANIRINGIDGVLISNNLERGGIVVGDLEYTSVSVNGVHWSRIPNLIDYGVHLGPFAFNVDLCQLVASRAGATSDPRANATDGSDFRIVYDEVTGKKASNLRSFCGRYRRDVTGAVDTDLVMS